MFDYNIKDQVLLLNRKTFGLENELKDLEEKIRIGQNRLHGIQRLLRREIPSKNTSHCKKGGVSNKKHRNTSVLRRIHALQASPNFAYRRLIPLLYGLIST